MPTKSLILLTLTVSSLASAGALGIEPGSSTRDDVIKKFGEPSKILVGKDGKEIIGYFGARSPSATLQQVQFRVSADTKRVERLDLFPASGKPVQKAMLVKKYGGECPEGVLPEAPCYVKKVTDDGKPYFLYVRLGLAVFFKADFDTVTTLVFTSVKR